MENSGQTTNTPSIETLLEECIRRNASDLHIQYGLPPILRVDGVLTPIAGNANLNDETIRNLIFATLDEEQQKILIKDKEFDYSFAFGDVTGVRGVKDVSADNADRWYDLQGRRVTKPSNGLYIVNGKTVLVK